MKRRGQIAVFMIIGVLLLIIIAGLLFVRNHFEKEEIKFKEDKVIDSVQVGEYVQTYTETCLEKVAKDSIIYLAAHGGYEYGSNFSIEYNGEDRPYYFHLNETFVPELTEVKKAFSDYVNKELTYCMAVLYEVEKGYSLTFPSPKIDVDIMEESINFQVDFELVVEKGDTKKEFNLFEVIIPTSFLTLYNAAKNITIAQMEYPDFIIRSNLIDLAEEHGLKIETISISESDVIYEIIDENNLVNGEALVYSFAFKYDWGSSEDENEE